MVWLFDRHCGCHICKVGPWLSSWKGCQCRRWTSAARTSPLTQPPITNKLKEAGQVPPPGHRMNAAGRGPVASLRLKGK